MSSLTPSSRGGHLPRHPVGHCILALGAAGALLTACSPSSAPPTPPPPPLTVAQQAAAIERGKAIAAETFGVLSANLQTALIAFREVSDALISRQRFEEGRVEQAQAVEAGRQSVQLATARFKEGRASYYEVLEAQQLLFPAENTLARLEAARRLAVIQLYRALGGGWANTEASTQAAAGNASPAK